MNRSDWGRKRFCLECSTRFYDFNKDPIICPSCKTVLDPEYLLKRKTKNSQEKIDEVEDLKVDIEFDELQSDASDDVVVGIDDEEDELPLDEEEK